MYDSRIPSPSNAPEGRAVPARVAMVGTFDVENLGDLLFPLVAHHELAKRLGDVEIELFSYRAFDPPNWPFKVRPIHTLAERLGEFDLLLVGGGHLIRGDEGVAPGYEPTSAVTSHPYGLWLTPTLLALAAGVPVAWNALGVIDSVSAVHEPLYKAALRGIDYLAVRDLESARLVRAHSPHAAPVVVPDSVFGIGELLDDASRHEATRLLAANGVGGGYVVVQPSAILEDFRDAVEAIAVAATARGLSVVELACGPCHHDRPGRLRLSTPTTPIEPWPAPLVVAAMIAGAQGVVASSLHAGIIATSTGTPLFRPRAAPGSKHEHLDLLPGVSALPEDGSDVEPTTDFDRGVPSSQVTGHRVALQHHWDEVARRCTGRGTRGPRDSVAELLEAIPDVLETRDRLAREQVDGLTETLERERQRSTDEIADLEQQLALERGLVEHLNAMLARKSVSAALAVADQLGALRAASHRGSTGRKSDR
ncbi:MAG TPA: polysaccharide pyruvyl transferase family protein [Acidimicrobiales bacterium]